MTTIQYGDTVEFTATWPGREPEVLRGSVTYVPDRIPGNPQVWTKLGTHEVLARDLKLVSRDGRIRPDLWA